MNRRMEQYEYIKNYLRLLKPKSIGVCHFIGKEKYAKLHHDCKADVFYNYIGKEINLE